MRMEWYRKGQRNVFIDNVFETEWGSIWFRMSLCVLLSIHIWLVLLCECSCHSMSVVYLWLQQKHYCHSNRQFICCIRIYIYMYPWEVYGFQYQVGMPSLSSFMQIYDIFPINRNPFFVKTSIFISRITRILRMTISVIWNLS